MIEYTQPYGMMTVTKSWHKQDAPKKKENDFEKQWRHRKDEVTAQRTGLFLNEEGKTLGTLHALENWSIANH